MLKNKKTIALIIIIGAILIAGLVMTIVKGINYDLIYSKSTRIEIYIEPNFEMNDIKSIIESTFGNQKYIIQKVNMSEKMIGVTLKEISEDQINSFVQKINEKYATELTADDIQIYQNSNIKIEDIVYQYILSIILSLIIILIYLMLRFRKLGVWKVLLNTIASLILIQLLYISIYSITRLPINIITIPIALLIFVLNIFVLTLKFENKLLKKEFDK